MQLGSRHLLLGLLALGVILSATACSIGGSSPSGNGAKVTAGGDQNSEMGTEAESTAGFRCTEANPHPIGESIAKTYDVTYEQVMTWFCSGYTFDDILIALETSEATGVKAADLLAMSKEMSWEDIWAEVGFTPQ